MHHLIHQLGRAIGYKNVAFDQVTRLLYSTDASNYQIPPVGVTFPRHADDVCVIHEIATRHAVPILPRGGGTSLAGQTVGEAIVIDFTRHMRRIQAINAEEQTITVEPGMVLEQMNHQLKPLGLMFGPDPASANRAVIGGCLGNNATGTHSILYGMTADHVTTLEVVLASGEKIRLGNGSTGTTVRHLQNGIQSILHRYTDAIHSRYPKTWRTVAGYALNRMDANVPDLTQLIVGSEGTLASVVSAELALVQRPTMTRLAIVHFDDLYQSLETTPAILETEPSAIELLDKLLLDRTRKQPEYARHLQFVEGNPAAILAVEYYGNTDAELTSKITRLKQRLTKSDHHDTVIVLETPQAQANVWTVRKAGLGLLASNRGDWKTVPLIEDAAVPVEHLADYIARISEIMASEGVEMSVYAHASAGCLHVRPLLNMKTTEGLRQYRAIGSAAVDAVMAFNGTTSGEHGEGLVRSEFNARLFGPDLTTAFREVKQMFDPHNLMNPHKIVDPLSMDDPTILRYGPSYTTPLELVDTRFDWSPDHGFAGAIEMCNGSGVCRKESSGTMCPSFRATREERDSTRGRANILRLAMTGAFGLDNMHDERVKNVLDLCLSCKACKAECPSAVDMARLKAEFMAAYHDHHSLSRRSWLFGNVHRLSVWGSRWPTASNFLLNLPLVSTWAKQIVGIATERAMPRYARQRFSQWWNQQIPQPRHKKPARPTPIFLIDTFTEYHHPEIGRALHYLMAQSGLTMRAMRLPQKGCCGRPAMSKGMLDHAKHMANANVPFLAKLITQDPDVRFMIAEPSCASALRDDYTALVDRDWQDHAADIARRTFSLEEWLEEWRGEGGFHDLSWDHQPREIILHGHCHQKALWGTDTSMRILQSIPAAMVREIDTGCCGMAGSFGYEQEHYDISMQIAELRLYPAVRNNPQAIIAASGTSCREQIEHIRGQVRHPVEIIAEASGWKRG